MLTVAKTLWDIDPPNGQLDIQLLRRGCHLGLHHIRILDDSRGQLLHHMRLCNDPQAADRQGLPWYR